jgi:hypothetical protein
MASQVTTETLGESVVREHSSVLSIKRCSSTMTSADLPPVGVSGLAGATDKKIV